LLASPGQPGQVCIHRCALPSHSLMHCGVPDSYANDFPHPSSFGHIVLCVECRMASEVTTRACKTIFCTSEGGRRARQTTPGQTRLAAAVPGPMEQQLPAKPRRARASVPAALWMKRRRSHCTKTPSLHPWQLAGCFLHSPAGTPHGVRHTILKRRFMRRQRATYGP
jgi:hypothetical protein